MNGLTRLAILMLTAVLLHLPADGLAVAGAQQTAPRKITPPSRPLGTSKSGKKKRSAGVPYWQTMAVLAGIVAVILIGARLLKKHGPLMNGGIPEEALEVLGKRAIDRGQLVYPDSTRLKDSHRRFVDQRTANPWRSDGSRRDRLPRRHVPAIERAFPAGAGISDTVQPPVRSRGRERAQRRATVTTDARRVRTCPRTRTRPCLRPAQDPRRLCPPRCSAGRRASCAGCGGSGFWPPW